MLGQGDFLQTIGREFYRMNRAQLKQYILETYNCEADHPWMNFPGNEVFRHSNNRKWFALIMDVPRERLGLAGTEPLDVVNLNCDPIISSRDWHLSSIPHEQSELDYRRIGRKCTK